MEAKVLMDLVSSENFFMSVCAVFFGVAPNLTKPSYHQIGISHISNTLCKLLYFLHLVIPILRELR